MLLINQVSAGITPKRLAIEYKGMGSDRRNSVIRIFLVLKVTGMLIKPLFGQPGPNRAPGIGSATVIQKQAGRDIDRWEITFHDAFHKNRVLWILVKTGRGESFGSATYRFRKKPFDAFGMRDILGLVYLDGKERAVRKGRAKLAISGQELNLHARLRLNNSRTLKYDYQGKFRIIEVKE